VPEPDVSSETEANFDASTDEPTELVTGEVSESQRRTSAVGGAHAIETESSVSDAKPAKKRLALPKIKLRGNWKGLMAPLGVALIGAASFSFVFGTVFTSKLNSQVKSKHSTVETSIGELKGLVAAHGDRLAKFEGHFDSVLSGSPTSTAKDLEGTPSPGHDLGANGASTGHDAHATPPSDSHGPKHGTEPEKPTGHEAESHAQKVPEHGEPKTGPAKHTIETHGAEGFNLAKPKDPHTPEKPWASGEHEVHTTNGKTLKVSPKGSSGHKSAQQGHDNHAKSVASHGRASSGHGKAQTTATGHSSSTKGHGAGSAHQSGHSSAKHPTTNRGGHAKTHRGAHAKPKTKASGSIKVYLNGQVVGTPKSSH
jgi:hypothetical protein